MTTQLLKNISADFETVVLRGKSEPADNKKINENFLFGMHENKKLTHTA